MAASSTSLAADWVLELVGTVADFYFAGYVSAGLDTHYGNDEAYEYRYAPTASTPACASASPARPATAPHQRQIPLISLTTTSLTPTSSPPTAPASTLDVNELTGGDSVIDQGQTGPPNTASSAASRHPRSPWAAARGPRTQDLASADFPAGIIAE